ncbi:MAG: hypothetical protein AAGA57_05585 [Planctomycetota bacterium]
MPLVRAGLCLAIGLACGVGNQPATAEILSPTSAVADDALRPDALTIEQQRAWNSLIAELYARDEPRPLSEAERAVVTAIIEPYQEWRRWPMPLRGVLRYKDGRPVADGLVEFLGGNTSSLVPNQRPSRGSLRTDAQGRFSVTIQEHCDRIYFGKYGHYLVQIDHVNLLREGTPADYIRYLEEGGRPDWLTYFVNGMQVELQPWIDRRTELVEFDGELRCGVDGPTRVFHLDPDELVGEVVYWDAAKEPFRDVGEAATTEEGEGPAELPTPRIVVEAKRDGAWFASVPRVPGSNVPRDIVPDGFRLRVVGEGIELRKLGLLRHRDMREMDQAPDAGYSDVVEFSADEVRGMENMRRVGLYVRVFGRYGRMDMHLFPQFQYSDSRELRWVSELHLETHVGIQPDGSRNLCQGPVRRR